MDDVTRRVLADLIRQKGTDLATDLRRLEAFLRDLCPGQKLAINLLVNAARHGVPERLDDPAVPLPIRLAQQTAHLVDSLGLAEDKARWAVEVWAAALGADGAATPSPGASGAGEPARAAAGRPPAVLVVESDPAGATVLLNGDPLGPTPLRHAIELGSFARLPVTLALQLAGHTAQETTVELRAGERTVWRDVRLVGETARREGRPSTGGRPANWPDYLNKFTPPVGMDWSSFRVSDIDGMPQVLIPAGEFLMGSPADEKDRQSNEGPQRQIRMSAFWMDLHEVTNGQYCMFLNAQQPPEGQRKGWVSLAGEKESTYLTPQILQRGGRYVPEAGKENYPVIWVTWHGATAYAEWAGRSLPTEAQWERAARGGRQTKYVWGPATRRRWEPGTCATRRRSAVSPIGASRACTSRATMMATKRRVRWRHSGRMLSDCTIWQVTFGSGARTSTRPSGMARWRAGIPSI